MGMGLILGLILLLWEIRWVHVWLLVLGLDPHQGEHPWGLLVGLRGAKLWDLRGTQLC